MQKVPIILAEASRCGHGQPRIKVVDVSEFVIPGNGPMQSPGVANSTPAKPKKSSFPWLVTGALVGGLLLRRKLKKQAKK